MTTPRATTNDICSIINTGRGIGTIFRGEPWNLAKRPAEFQKIAVENCGRYLSGKKHGKKSASDKQSKGLDLITDTDLDELQFARFKSIVAVQC